MRHAEISHAVHIGTEVHTSTTTTVRIGCDDALLVRADLFVLGRLNGDLHAIIDGVISHLGQVSPDVIARLMHNPRVIVESPHFTGGHVRREVPVSVH